MAEPGTIVLAMLPTAIVPIRTGAGAKRRLAHLLSAEARQRLVDDLFRHVVGVLTQTGLRTIALSPTRLTDAAGAEVWLDRGHGLNEALDAAVHEAGTPVLIVHADLPLISADDVDALVEAPGDVVIARARDGGTNALLMRRPIRCAFGPSSALAHARRARAVRFRTLVLDRPGLALDVDDAASLSAASLRVPRRAT
jgi:2-phospho-L-lactate guanylyltransferase